VNVNGKPTGRELSAKDQLALIETLEAEGYSILKHPPRERSAKLDIKVKPGGIVRLGLVSDTHLASRKQQITALCDFYKYADGKGVQAYLHAGDLLDGLHVHRDTVYNQFAHGLDAQLSYAARVYPKSENGPTWAIQGNHDLWYYGNVGASPGQYLEEKRPDIKDLGHQSAFLEIGGLRAYICHGSKGGSSYARSYKVQKLIEQMEVEQRSQTDLAFFGHWHTYLDLGRYQGVYTWSLGAFQAQTSFERTLGKSPAVCGMVLEIEFTKDKKVWDIRQDVRWYEPRVGDYPGGERDAE